MIYSVFSQSDWFYCKWNIALREIPQNSKRNYTIWILKIVNSGKKLLICMSIGSLSSRGIDSGQRDHYPPSRKYGTDERMSVRYQRSPRPDAANILLYYQFLHSGWILESESINIIIT
jgi:hypothetical protein